MSTVTFAVHNLYTDCNISDYERPDVPVNLSISDIGARWTTLRWATFDDNAPILGVILYVHDLADNLTVVSNITANSLATTGRSVQLNVSGISPFTLYSFRVMACNEAGCSASSLESPTMRTLQDSE